MRGPMARRTLAKNFNGGGGPRVEPRGLHKNFERPNGQTQGATWQPFIGPRGALLFAQLKATCQNVIRPLSTNQNLPRQLGCHVSCHGCIIMPRHCTAFTSAVRPMPRQLYGLPSQHPFFSCLAIRIDRDNF
jgi:hypothetical protein